MFLSTKHCGPPHHPSLSVPLLWVNWKRAHCLPPAALSTVSLSCSWQQSWMLMDNQMGDAHCAPAIRQCHSSWEKGRQADRPSDGTQTQGQDVIHYVLTAAVGSSFRIKPLSVTWGNNSQKLRLGVRNACWENAASSLTSAGSTTMQYFLQTVPESLKCLIESPTFYTEDAWDWMDKNPSNSANWEQADGKWLVYALWSTSAMPSISLHPGELHPSSRMALCFNWELWLNLNVRRHGEAEEQTQGNGCSETLFKILRLIYAPPVAFMQPFANAHVFMDFSFQLTARWLGFAEEMKSLSAELRLITHHKLSTVGSWPFPTL